ncbi:hypothetical protein [Pedomonas sp. V897]|uniref:hypothetical protein n=1 Tax=Pedomonas sp. V897 TaxID=3446482 RepID=UPI003EE1EDB7
MMTMKRFLPIAVIASALLVPHIAHASPPTGTLTGTVVVHKGITLTCTLTLTISSGGTATIALTPGDSNCAALSFNNQPYATSYSGGSTGTFTVKDVDVSTITLGDCKGDISGTWTGSTLVINATLPPKTGGPSCSVVGTAS